MTTDEASPSPAAVEETPTPVPNPESSPAAVPTPSRHRAVVPRRPALRPRVASSRDAPLRPLRTPRQRPRSPDRRSRAPSRQAEHGAPGISVSVYSYPAPDEVVASAITAADGTFTTTPGLPARLLRGYKIRFDGDERYEGLGWWAGNGQISHVLGALVHVDGVNPVVGIDCQRGSHQSGYRNSRDRGGPAHQGGCARTDRGAPRLSTAARRLWQPDGSFSVQIRSGDSRRRRERTTRRFSGPTGSGLLSGWYSSTQPGKWVPDKASATPIVLTNVDKSLGKITIPLPRTITGTVVAGARPRTPACPWSRPTRHWSTVPSPGPTGRSRWSVRRPGRIDCG